MSMGMRMMVVGVVVVMFLVQMVASSDLRPGFYSETCPNAEVIVRDVMKRALAVEPRSVASVMRFQFHDCFVNVSTCVFSSSVNCHFVSVCLICDFWWCMMVVGSGV